MRGLSEAYANGFTLTEFITRELKLILPELQAEGLNDDTFTNSSQTLVIDRVMNHYIEASLESRKHMRPFISNNFEDFNGIKRKSVCNFLRRTYAKHVRTISLVAKFRAAVKEVLQLILFDSGLHLFWVKRSIEEAIRWRQKAAPEPKIVMPISTRDERILALIHIVTACYALT